MLFTKALLVAILTWLCSAFSGTLILALLTMIKSLSVESAVPVTTSGGLWFFLFVFFLSLAYLLITVPLNILVLILTKKLSSTVSLSLRVFFLLSAYTILSPFTVAIIPFTRDLFFQNVLYLALTIGGFVIITFICFVLVKNNYRASILLYIFLNIMFLVGLNFLSIDDGPLMNLWLSAIFHAPGIIMLAILARSFKFLDIPVKLLRS